MIGASSLHEAQIVGVIDDPRKIRVLVIDPDLHVVTAVADRTIQMSGERRGRLAHESSSVPPPNNPNCAGSRAGSARPRWRKACEVSNRPRGVRCRYPHWIR